MPFPLAPFVAALLGIAFALVDRDELRRTSMRPAGTRGFLVVALASGLLLAPALAYFVAFYPDWAYSYLVSGAQVPSAIDLVEIICVTAIPPAMFAWTANALRRHDVRGLVRVGSAVVGAFALAVALLGPRMVVAGTYRAYHEGTDARPVAATSLGVSILWVDGCLVCGALWAMSRLLRDGAIGSARTRSYDPGP